MTRLGHGLIIGAGILIGLAIFGVVNGIVSSLASTPWWVTALLTAGLFVYPIRRARAESLARRARDAEIMRGEL